MPREGKPIPRDETQPKVIWEARNLRAVRLPAAIQAKDCGIVLEKKGDRDAMGNQAWIPIQAGDLSPEAMKEILPETYKAGWAHGHSGVALERNR